MLAGVFLALVSFGTFSRVFAQNGTTREQMTLTLAQALNLPAPPACVSGAEMFTDVPASSPFCPYIEELARRGVTGGCAPGLYCPRNFVTREQMATFLVKSVGTAFQTHTGTNLTLSNNPATPTTVNTLLLPGPSTYLVQATATIFTQTAVGVNCTARMRIQRDGVDVGTFNDVGAALPVAGNFIEGTYSAQRLLAVSAVGATITVVGARQFGAGDCVAFSRTLTASQIGNSATGTLAPAPASSEEKAGP